MDREGKQCVLRSEERKSKTKWKTFSVAGLLSVKYKDGERDTKSTIGKREAGARPRAIKCSSHGELVDQVVTMSCCNSAN